MMHPSKYLQGIQEGKQFNYTNTDRCFIIPANRNINKKNFILDTMLAPISDL